MNLPLNTDGWYRIDDLLEGRYVAWPPTDRYAGKHDRYLSLTNMGGSTRFMLDLEPFDETFSVKLREAVRRSPQAELCFDESGSCRGIRPHATMKAHHFTFGWPGKTAVELSDAFRASGLDIFDTGLSVHSSAAIIAIYAASEDDIALLASLLSLTQ